MIRVDQTPLIGTDLSTLMKGTHNNATKWRVFEF